MELTDITARAEASRGLRTADVAGPREVRITFVYDEADIEAAADAAGVDLGAADRDSMLLLLDDAIADIVRTGIRSALDDKISEEMRACVAGHCCGDDE